MLVKNAKDILMKAKSGNFVIPSFNFIDLDSARVFCRTAEKHNFPLILAFAEVHKNLIALEEAALVGKFLAEECKAPVILHLDHGTETEYCVRAMELGFTSVMIDASMNDFEGNVRTTREVVEAARAYGVQVEAEIGHVGSNVTESDSSLYTEPEEAARFVSESGCDSLAVSIGTSHGVYKTGTPKLNFDVLHGIARTIPDTPLVLHGGSGSGDDNLARCSREGITKINICTDCYVAALKAVKDPALTDYFDAKAASDKAVGEVAEHYYKVFGTKPID